MPEFLQASQRKTKGNPKIRKVKDDCTNHKLCFYKEKRALANSWTSNKNLESGIILFQNHLIKTVGKNQLRPWFCYSNMRRQKKNITSCLFLCLQFVLWWTVFGLRHRKNLRPCLLLICYW